MPLRALLEIRLSGETEESTSPERQQQQDEAYCGIKSWSIVHTCRDLDVSGGISPFERPELGKWLTTPELIDRWDVLVVSRLDRLSRSVFSYADLIRWCEANGKAIAVVAENFDLTTAVGRATAMIIIVFAQLMREQTAENRRAAQATLRAAMLYGGGPVHYGYEPEKDGAHWILRRCWHEALTANYWADQVIDHGRSTSALTHEMHMRGVKTKYGKDFPDGRILEILRSPTLRGYVLYWPHPLPGQKVKPKPQIVLGDDGMPLQREPVITDEKWFKLQAALDRNAHDRHRVRRTNSPLLGVVHCFLCGFFGAAPRLTINPYQSGHAYYRCPRTKLARAINGIPCVSKAIPAQWLQDKARDVFLAEAGHVPIMTRIVTPDTSHATQIAAIGHQIAELTTERFVLGVQREDYDKHIATLTKQHAELSAAPGKPPEVRWEDTGRTVTDEWEARDEDGRRLLMIDAGFKINIAKMRSGGMILSHTFVPDLERRAALAATGASMVPAIPNELTGAMAVMTFDRQGQEVQDSEIYAELGIAENPDL
jgi:site-specific DNA recombinase